MCASASIHVRSAAGRVPVPIARQIGVQTASACGGSFGNVYSRFVGIKYGSLGVIELAQVRERVRHPPRGSLRIRRHHAHELSTVVIMNFHDLFVGFI